MLQYFNQVEVDEAQWLRGIRESWLAVDAEQGTYLVREQRPIDFVHRIPWADDAGTYVCKLVLPDGEHHFRAGTNEAALSYANGYVAMLRRKKAMDSLRRMVNDAYTYAVIGRSCGKHPSTIGETLRGNYPWYQAYGLPDYLRTWLEDRGFEVPDILNGR